MPQPNDVSAAVDPLEELVLRAVAAAGGLERANLSRATSLLEANVDSLTLIGLIAGLELELSIVFSDADALALVEARDLAQLCAAVARKLALAESAAESVRTAEISERRPPMEEGSMTSSGFMVEPPG